MRKFTRDPRRHGSATLYKFAALLVPEGFLGLCRETNTTSGKRPYVYQVPTTVERAGSPISTKMKSRG